MSQKTIELMPYSDCTTIYRYVHGNWRACDIFSFTVALKNVIIWAFRRSPGLIIICPIQYDAHPFLRLFEQQTVDINAEPYGPQTVLRGPRLVLRLLHQKR